MTEKEIMSNRKKYPIICFEGPSGVGKSTMSELLSATYNIVPEVNLLYERKGGESKYWYHERQLDRYERCSNANRASILDGDIFQPIWYNWVCKYPQKFLSKEETHTFYREKLLASQMRFPDLYIVFEAPESELRKRKENDKLRRRRNFEKHLKIIEPLKTYYQFLLAETALNLCFIEYTTIADTKEKALAKIKDQKWEDKNDLAIFLQIEDWIEKSQKEHKNQL